MLSTARKAQITPTTQRVKKATGAVTTFYPNKYVDTAGTSDSAITGGGPADTWGRSWMAEELSDGNFRLWAWSHDGTNREVNVDHIQAKVYYTPSQTTSGTTTRYIHPDHLGGTNAVSDEAGDLLQTLDYYPYGAERIATGDNATDRHYIGERFDDETELSYLNARYYGSDRGQFLSQDPVHFAVGDAAKLREHTALDPRTFLSDPQGLNSYSYARGNPIRFSDPKGLWYVELAVGGNFAVFSASTGVRVDGKGVEWFVSGGPTFGVSGPLEASFSSGDLSHKPEITVSRNAKLMAIAGMGISEQGEYDYENPLSTAKNRQTSYSVNVGLGGGASQEYTLSTPIVNYGSQNQSSNQQSASISASYNSLVNSLSNLVSSLKSYVQSQNQSQNRKP